ncbi:MAG: hypothetical protein K0S12_889 [Bacteroidetes bacterium]|nr:hypothetical protein [Bacteroidota bacterium]
MRNILCLLLLILASAPAESRSLPRIMTEKGIPVATETYKNNLITIYKNTDVNCPYSITITNSKTKKEMMVIGQDDELFKFILIEKTEKEICYFPFAWLDREIISVADLKENCRKILDDLVKPIERIPLK